MSVNLKLKNRSEKLFSVGKLFGQNIFHPTRNCNNIIIIHSLSKTYGNYSWHSVYFKRKFKVSKVSEYMKGSREVEWVNAPTP